MFDEGREGLDFPVVSDTICFHEYPRRESDRSPEHRCALCRVRGEGSPVERPHARAPLPLTSPSDDLNWA